MRYAEFYQDLVELSGALRKKQDIPLALIHLFKSELDGLLNDVEADERLKMTRMSVLFEALYKCIPDEPAETKRIILNLRLKRWATHFGTPTLFFLTSYQDQINQTCTYLMDNARGEMLSNSPINKPWLVGRCSSSVEDQVNEVVVRSERLPYAQASERKEITGFFTKTHNPIGGFATTPCDSVSQKFIEHASKAAKRNGKVLEIGAAFGAATLEALATGVTIFSNDIEPKNLAVVLDRYTESIGNDESSATGDRQKLIFVPGEFPHELAGLPKNTFDAILICRVLHFFTGRKIEDSLAKLADLLVPGGKIYIVCETPYLKNWRGFIPEFNARCERAVEWPGEITEPALYESSGRAASLPKFVHWITKPIIERSLRRTGYEIQSVEYMSRRGQFPDDLLLGDDHPEHGKESVGAIGVKLS